VRAAPGRNQPAAVGGLLSSGHSAELSARSTNLKKDSREARWRECGFRRPVPMPSGT
jgi:hypothetical protein